MVFAVVIVQAFTCCWTRQEEGDDGLLHDEEVRVFTYPSREKEEEKAPDDQPRSARAGDSGLWLSFWTRDEEDGRTNRSVGQEDDPTLSSSDVSPLWSCLTQLVSPANTKTSEVHRGLEPSSLSVAFSHGCHACVCMV